MPAANRPIVVAAAPSSLAVRPESSVVVAALLPVWRPARTPPMPPAAAIPARKADPEVLPGSVNANSL